MVESKDTGCTVVGDDACRGQRLATAAEAPDGGTVQ